MCTAKAGDANVALEHPDFNCLKEVQFDPWQRETHGNPIARRLAADYNVGRALCALTIEMKISM